MERRANRIASLQCQRYKPTAPGQENSKQAILIFQFVGTVSHFGLQIDAVQWQLHSLRMRLNIIPTVSRDVVAQESCVF